MEYDAGDELAVKQKKTKAQLRQEREQEEVRALLQVPGNRYFLWKLLSRCKLFDTSSHLDAHAMAIHSGRRDVGIELLKEITEASPDILYTMKMEANDRDSS
jgi:hypothetical protein